MRLVLKNGKIVTPTGVVRGGIVSEDGQITHIGADSTLPSGADVIDAAGKWVIPGVIDPHTHIGVGPANATMDRIRACWESESRAAVHKGVTTVISFQGGSPIPMREPHVPMLEQYRIQHRYRLRIPYLERCPRAGVHVALPGRKRAEHRHDGGAIDVHRGQRVTHIVGAPRLLLFLQARDHFADDLGHARSTGRARRGAVTVLLAQVLRHAYGKAARVLQTAVHHLQTARPSQAAFATNFAREVHDHGTRGCVRRKQRRRG